MAKYPTGPDLLVDFQGLFRSQLRAGSGAVTGSAADPLVAPEVTNLHLTSTSVLDNYQGSYVSIVKATWDPIVADTSETADSDVSPVTDYLASYAYAGEGWSREGGTGGVNAFTTHAVPTGVEVTVRIRARRQSGAVGPYTTATITTARDETPPPRPSKPTVIGTVRGVSVGWDGLFVQPDGTGTAPRPADFAYVIAEVSLDAGFADITKGGVLSERGQTAVTRLTDGTPFTAYARLVAVDHSGNRSALSEVTQGGSIRIIDKDVGESAITTTKLAEAAVTAEKILNGAVETLKLATGAVTGVKLADLSVSVDKVVDGAISASKTALAAIDPNSGTLAIDSVATNNLQANAVTANAIATNAVIARHVVAGEIITEKLAVSAVTAEKINSLAVSTDKLAANAVTADKIEANTITASQIAAGAITADELSAFAVTSKVITGGVFRSGVEGEDRVEIRDETVYDPYLGYNRSIRDTIRWQRGYDNATVAEVRGYMGDIGAYGLHLNSHVEIGNTQSVIYQVGKRAAIGPSSVVRLRANRKLCYVNLPNAFLQNFDCFFDTALDQAPTFVVAVPAGGGNSGLDLITQIQVSSISANGFSGTVFYQGGALPGAGTQFYLSYYAEVVV